METINQQAEAIRGDVSAHTISPQESNNAAGYKQLDADEISANPSKSTEMNINSIKFGTLYEYSKLIDEGFEFARIKVNREIDPKNVNKKKVSMRGFKGAIMPFLVAKASDALDSNLTVVLDDGTEVTRDTVGLDKILVLLDGQHRRTALEKLYKEGETSISAYVMLPLMSPGTRIESVLQEVNTAVNPWDGIDWLTSLAVNAKEHGLSVESIEFVKELSGESGISDSASALWG
ncbi:MAG: hypothetical protein K2K97_10555, partial [Muribaculaceae bacterium]|nr:hypothetical protein [Muribaculaceae bacterium]